MEELSKLLTSVAALTSALAWPSALLATVVIFKSEMKSTLQMVPILLERLKKASLPGIGIELEKVSNAEANNGSVRSGEITPLQIDAAKRISFQTQDIGSQAVVSEMDRLCLEYDSVRRTMKAGAQRTRSMTSVLVKMRALAPSVVEYLQIYKSSGSAGSRLAAIAIMQMTPRTADLEWLGARFSNDQPFVFYHAALALQNFANVAATELDKSRLREIAVNAKTTVQAFNGNPDESTIDVLDNLIVSIS